MLGAEILEVHVCWSKEMFGPDTLASLTLGELSEVCSFRDKSVDFLKEIDKDITAIELTELRNLFGRSLVANKAIPAGEFLTQDMIAYKKPSGGLHYSEIQKIIGKKVVKDLVQDEQISLDFLS